MESENKPPKYYVGIGASAGGLEALQDFFGKLPEVKDVAFIVVQHLAPDFKSVMVELLSKTTNMKVKQAVDGTQVLAQTIYLIPPGKSLMIGEGKLLVSDQMPERGNRFPIDFFLRSLAEDCQHRSVAIILSGTGSDGSRGITAIKEVGGLVLVQSPDSAKFDGMPYNAIQTNCADYVAPTVQLAEKLKQYLSHPILNAPDLNDQEGASIHILTEIYRLIELESDIDFTRYKSQTIRRRIQRRMGIKQVSTLTDYFALLQKDKEELVSLSKEMLIGVTRFFRDDEAFSYLDKEVIPDLIDNLPDKSTLRVWSVGCSTGEEPISLAILADEYIRKHNREIEIKIFATDVDPDAIAVASQGRFLPNVVEDLGQERFEKYFEGEGDLFHLIPRIRKMVVFAVHNVISDPPFSNVHLAVCRNVLIYFQSETQERVLNMLQFSLKIDGFLFLGASETHKPIANCLEVKSEKYRVYKKIGNLPSILHSGTDALSRPERRTPSIEKILKGYEKENTSVYNRLIESILEDYMPPSLLVSDDKQVLHLYGNIVQYTRNPAVGKPSNLVSDILVESLTVPISTALQRVSEEEKTITYKDVPVTTKNEEVFKCDLTVSRYQNTPKGPVYYLLVVSRSIEQKEAPSLKYSDIEEIYNSDTVSAQRIKDLEAELRTTTDRLNLTVEELETTNEELQSSNEELLASNEELQSTNEELQSVNEELYTVNSEYQEKIKEVSTMNDDFNSLVNTVDVGIIFLDEQLLIRKFSPAASRHVNLLPGDIGRPIHHIAHNLEMPAFLDTIAQVASTGVAFVEEVPTKNGGWVSMRINAVKSSRVAMEGGRSCVISLTDISNIRSTEGAIKQAYTQLRKSVAVKANLDRQTLRTLILDDDPDEVYLIESRLSDIESMNFECTGLSDVDEFKEAITSSNYDLCILDLNLGELDAFDVLDDIGANHITTPILLVSGALTSDKAHQAASFGVYDTIEKQNMLPTVMEHITRFVFQQKQLEQILVSHARTAGE